MSGVSSQKNFKKCVLNEKFNQQMATIRALFAKIRKLFSSLRETGDQGRSLPPSSPQLHTCSNKSVQNTFVDQIYYNETKNDIFRVRAETYNLLKKESLAQVFSCEFCFCFPCEFLRLLLSQFRANCCETLRKLCVSTKSIHQEIS